MNQPLDFSSTIVRNPDIISTDMDGDTVMMSIEHGNYYSISGIGSFLWELLLEPVTIEFLCQRVLDEFDIDEATCRSDTMEFLAELLEQGGVRHAG